MGNAVITRKKTEEVKSKTSSGARQGVAINQNERFVSAYPFTLLNFNQGPKNRGREVKEP